MGMRVKNYQRALDVRLYYTCDHGTAGLCPGARAELSPQEFCAARKADATDEPRCVTVSEHRLKFTG